MILKRQKILRTLFFIGVVIIVIVNSTMSYASMGQIDVNSVDINETKIDELKPMFKIILGFVQMIGSAISVIIIVVIGIKYIYSSIEEKAAYKQTMIYYVIGAILLFSAVNLMTMAYNIFNS